MFLFITVLYVIKNYCKSGIEMVSKAFIKLYAIYYYISFKYTFSHP